MNWEEYKVLSEKTLSTEFHCDKKDELLLHAVMGILTEMEELLDNHMSDQSDDNNRIEEIADAWWYICIIGRELENINVTNSVDSSIEDPMIAILGIIKSSLKLLDFLKKKIYYNKSINLELFTHHSNQIISLLLVYAKLYKIDTPKSWDINIEKLRARYGEKFSSDKAINRNLEAEREILSKQ